MPIEHRHVVECTEFKVAKMQVGSVDKLSEANRADILLVMELRLSNSAVGPGRAILEVLEPGIHVRASVAQ